jgi:hypothetical protein
MGPGAPGARGPAGGGAGAPGAGQGRAPRPLGRPPPASTPPPPRFFAAYMLCGAWHSLSIFFVPAAALAAPAATDAAGAPGDLVSLGTAAFVSLVLTVTLKLATRTHCWTWVTYVVYGLSVALLLPFVYVLGIAWARTRISAVADMSGVEEQLFLHPGFWLAAVLLAPGLALLPDIAAAGFARYLRPTLAVLLQARWGCWGRGPGRGEWGGPGRGARSRTLRLALARGLGRHRPAWPRLPRLPRVANPPPLPPLDRRPSCCGGSPAARRPPRARRTATGCTTGQCRSCRPCSRPARPAAAAAAAPRRAAPRRAATRRRASRSSRGAAAAAAAGRAAAAALRAEAAAAASGGTSAGPVRAPGACFRGSWPREAHAAAACLCTSYRQPARARALGLRLTLRGLPRRSQPPVGPAPAPTPAGEPPPGVPAPPPPPPQVRTGRPRRRADILQNGARSRRDAAARGALGPLPRTPALLHSRPAARGMTELGLRAPLAPLWPPLLTPSRDNDPRPRARGRARARARREGPADQAGFCSDAFRPPGGYSFRRGALKQRPPTHARRRFASFR